MILRLIVVLVIGLALPLAAAAQAPQVAAGGRVLGPDTMPLAGQDVVLHRVDEAGGSTIAEVVTDEAGRFAMSAAAGADTSAVYFVAARHDGELYIGPPFKPGAPGSMDQVIQVGVPGMSASAMLGQAQGGSVLPQTGGRPATSRTWLLLLVPLLGVAAVAVFMLIPRTSIPQQRRLLIRVAELDERATAAAPAERDELRTARAEIMARLRTG